MPVSINRYDEKITRRLFFSMVPVQILLVMCSGVNIIIDSAFASNLIGPDAMAVTGLYGPFAKVMDSFNVLLFSGAQILCGKYLGENMMKRARSIFSIDIITMTVLGFIGTVLCIFFPSVPAMLSVKTSNPLYGDLIQYFRGIGVGIIPFLLGTQLTSFLQLEKKEKVGYVAIAGMFATNALCDFLFIKVFNMGIFGLGLATAAGNWVSFIIPAIHFLSKKASFRIITTDLSFHDLRDILKYGFPAAASQLMLAVRGLLINNMIIHYVGNDGMSAFSAVGSFGYIYWAVPAGMTSALITLASIYTGEKDKSAIELLMRIYFRKAVPLVCLASVVLALLSVPLTNIYFHDPSAAVYKMTLAGFILFPLSSPLSTIVIGIRDLWRCMEHHIAVHIINILDGLVLVAGMTYLLVIPFGMNGVWIGQTASGIILIVIIIIMTTIREKKFPSKISILCGYPKGFGVDDDNRLNLSIHNREEAINISEMVVDFCRKHGIDPNISTKAGLCVEELAINIVDHGFSGKSNSVFDISVTWTGEDLIIKFKDNCRSFNPEECDVIFNPEDPTHNIGIRIVKKLCKEMEYHSLLGLNVFSIKI